MSNSKPLQEQPEIFNTMIDRTDTIFMEFNGRQLPISYDLVGPLRFVDSKQYPGIQIADIAAGSVGFIFKESMKGKYAQYPKEWAEYLENSVSERSVLPDNLQYLDMSKVSVQLNFFCIGRIIREKC